MKSRLLIGLALLIVSTSGLAVGWAPEGADDTYQREQTTYELTIDEVIVDGSPAVVRDTWKIRRWIDGPAFPKK